MNASDGAATLEAFKGHNAGIYVVLLDLTMHGLNTAKIRRLSHDMVTKLPVPVMSGVSKKKSPGRYVSTNIAEFVAEPIGDVRTAISQMFTPADS